eukprot:gene25037-30052_t
MIAAHFFLLPLTVLAGRRASTATTRRCAGDSSLQDFFFVRFMNSTVPSNVQSVSRAGCYRCREFLKSVRSRGPSGRSFSA